MSKRVVNKRVSLALLYEVVAQATAASTILSKYFLYKVPLSSNGRLILETMRARLASAPGTPEQIAYGKPIDINREIPASIYLMGFDSNIVSSITVTLRAINYALSDIRKDEHGEFRLAILYLNALEEYIRKTLTNYAADLTDPAHLLPLLSLSLEIEVSLEAEG